MLCRGYGSSKTGEAVRRTENYESISAGFGWSGCDVALECRKRTEGEVRSVVPVCKSWSFWRTYYHYIGPEAA